MIWPLLPLTRTSLILLICLKTVNAQVSTLATSSTLSETSSCSSSGSVEQYLDCQKAKFSTTTLVVVGLAVIFGIFLIAGGIVWWSKRRRAARRSGTISGDRAEQGTKVIGDEEIDGDDLHEEGDDLDGDIDSMGQRSHILDEEKSVQGKGMKDNSKHTHLPSKAASSLLYDRRPSQGRPLLPMQNRQLPPHAKGQAQDNDGSQVRQSITGTNQDPSSLNSLQKSTKQAPAYPPDHNTPSSTTTKEEVVKADDRPFRTQTPTISRPQTRVENPSEDESASDSLFAPRGPSAGEETSSPPVSHIPTKPAAAQVKPIVQQRDTLEHVKNGSPISFSPPRQLILSNPSPTPTPRHLTDSRRLSILATDESVITYPPPEGPPPLPPTVSRSSAASSSRTHGTPDRKPSRESIFGTQPLSIRKTSSSSDRTTRSTTSERPSSRISMRKTSAPSAQAGGIPPVPSLSSHRRPSEGPLGERKLSESGSASGRAATAAAAAANATHEPRRPSQARTGRRPSERSQMI